MIRHQWFRPAVHLLCLTTAIWLLILGSSVGPTIAQAARLACVESIPPSGDWNDRGIEGNDKLTQDGGGSAGRMPGGSGGTGKQPGGAGGTGIIGTITAFSSVCVNGLKIDFDANTILRHNGVRVHLRNLALGQIVAIAADGPESQLEARHILILDALQGPVTRLDPRHGMLYVMDQPVIISDATRPNGPITLGALQLNHLVRVSGFRDASGVIHASRLEPVSYLKEHSAVGTLQQTASGSWNLSGIPLQVAEHSLSAEVGEKALVRGRWDGKRFVVREIEIDALPSLLEDDARIIAEGLVLEHQAPSTLRISNFAVELTPQTQIADTKANRLLTKGQTILVFGHLAGKNRIVADTIKGSGGAKSRGLSPSNRRAMRSTRRNVGPPDSLPGISDVPNVPGVPDDQEQTASPDHATPAGGKKNPAAAGSQGPIGGFGGGSRQGGRGGGAARGH
ncbi:MAG: hypothetical protein KDI50_00630 [Candidatus Competibacteraceae bacterium]|nr:hypothetical protein [Candidatus Competibacteraceae bacterium]